MNDYQHFFETFRWLIPIILILFVWESVWKVIAMWKSARNNHLGWFLCITLINTLGILPIIYIMKNKTK